MCELGSQGGLDGRWHCSAAQVQILFFKHASCLFYNCRYLFPCSCLKRFSVCMSACSVAGLWKVGDKKEAGRETG